VDADVEASNEKPTTTNNNPILRRLTGSSLDALGREVGRTVGTKPLLDAEQPTGRPLSYL
jgi:hypothetical protein